MSQIYQQNNTTYNFKNIEEFITNDKFNIIVFSTKFVNLQSNPLNFYKVNIFNSSPDPYILRTRSSNDMIYSSLYAPKGTKEIKILSKQFIEIVYIFDSVTRQGHWNLQIY